VIRWRFKDHVGDTGGALSVLDDAATANQRRCIPTEDSAEYQGQARPTSASASEQWLSLVFRFVH